MINRKLIGLVALGMLTLILWSVVSASAASNTVPQSRAGESKRAVAANDLKPPECASVSLTNKVSGSGEVRGGAGNDLILGSSASQRLRGDAGNDCLLGGDGDDEVRGEDGNDVLLGGAGNDTVDGGLGTDACYGGAGTDTFAGCETQVQ